MNAQCLASLAICCMLWISQSLALALLDSKPGNGIKYTADGDELLTADERPKSRYTTTSRFAYVAIHYEGTPKDDELTKTPHDFVVILSDNVRKSTRDLLKAEGCRILIVTNVPNPYKDNSKMRRSYKSRFEHTFNKLYIWNLSEYERVIYLDSDNIVVNNMDGVFMCGHFCVVLMNPVHFHTGLMVVRPNHKEFMSLVDGLQKMELFAYDGADQGYLSERFQDVEAAPLFTLESVKDGVPVDEPLMRLPVEYNMNHVFFYVRFNFEVFRRSRHPFSNRSVPMLSVGYPILPPAKPWYWHGLIFFDASWEWHKIRAELPNDDWTVWTLGYLVAFASYILVAKFVLVELIARSRPWHLFGKLFQFFALRAPVQFGYSLGVFLTMGSFGVLTFKIVDPMAPPLLGWPIFFLANILAIYSTLNLFSLLLDPLPLKPGWLWFVAWHTIQTNFLLKIAWVVFAIWLTVFAMAHPFRVEAERWAAKQPSRLAVTARPAMTVTNLAIV